MGSDASCCHSVLDVLWISIHAPRMGSDLKRSDDMTQKILFQSTLPGWGATPSVRPHTPIQAISIHAPRMGSDPLRCSLASVSYPFQSTLPGWGATSPHWATWAACSYFNPRSPDGERPEDCQGAEHAFGISIHAPRMGSDDRRRAQIRVRHDISIHAPRMGSDRENGHLRPRYGQNHPFSTLIVSQIVVDVLGTVRKSQKTPAH